MFIEIKQVTKDEKTESYLINLSYITHIKKEVHNVEFKDSCGNVEWKTVNCVNVYTIYGTKYTTLETYEDLKDRIIRKTLKPKS